MEWEQYTPLHNFDKVTEYVVRHLKKVGSYNSRKYNQNIMLIRIAREIKNLDINQHNFYWTHLTFENNSSLGFKNSIQIDIGSFNYEQLENKLGGYGYRRFYGGLRL